MKTTGLTLADADASYLEDIHAELMTIVDIEGELNKTKKVNGEESEG